VSLSELNEKELWGLYTSEKGQDVRNLLVKKYINFVTYLVGRIIIQLPAGLTKDDLIQFGICGLIEAIERFDPKQGAKFETYASIRIQGAIRDQIRYYGKYSGGLSRSAMSKSKFVDETVKKLETKLARHPLPKEIAEEMGISLEEYNKMLNEIGTSIPISLDDMVGTGDNLSVVQVIKNESSIIPEEEYLNGENNERLAEAIDELPDKERYVVMFYYYEEMTLKEIGKYLNLSEGRISQIHRKAMDKLKSKLQGE